jgi:hypothetical protein
VSEAPVINVPFADDAVGFEEASRILNGAFSPSSLALRQVRERNKIPHYKLGSKIYFRRSELEAWIASHGTIASPRAIPGYPKKAEQ